MADLLSVAPMTKVLGICVLHAIITPNCHVAQGSSQAAYEEASTRVKFEFMKLVAYWQGKGDVMPQMHLVLTMEPVQRKGRREEESDEN